MQETAAVIDCEAGDPCSSAIIKLCHAAYDLKVTCIHDTDGKEMQNIFN